MAYPFTAYPYKQVKTILQERGGCKIGQGEKFKNAKGDSFISTVVTRNVNGKQIQQAIEFGADDEMVNPNVLRSICARLGVDVAIFPGYHLG